MPPGTARGPKLRSGCFRTSRNGLEARRLLWRLGGTPMLALRSGVGAWVPPLAAASGLRWCVCHNPMHSTDLPQRQPERADFTLFFCFRALDFAEDAGSIAGTSIDNLSGPDSQTDSHQAFFIPSPLFFSLNALRDCLSPLLPPHKPAELNHLGDLPSADRLAELRHEDVHCRRAAALCDFAVDARRARSSECRRPANGMCGVVIRTGGRSRS